MTKNSRPNGRSFSAIAASVEWGALLVIRSNK